MKKFLIPDKKCFKANLHCHSTLSDGKFLPEELKKLYKEQGYSILAYTDHEILVPHTDLCDDEFLALTGYEAQIYGDRDLPKLLRRVIHLNFFPKDAERCTLPFFCKEEVYKIEPAPDLSKAFYEGDGDDKTEYTVECINSLIKKAKDEGFIVSYNHPTWSKEDAGIYTNLEGLFAMEIYNHGVEMLGYDAYCPYIYEEMLRSGQKIGCLATDDTHRSDDLFGGATYVYADRLTQESVAAALENGDFYASRGPVINGLWFEDGVFRIECSPVKEIRVSGSMRRSANVSLKRDEDGKITKAEFPLDETDEFVRFTLVDKEGKTANTRAYFRDEFEDKKPTAYAVKRKI